MRTQRPDPDALLEELEATERRARIGRLKVFLGYAAGVGKTYAMLEAAHSLRGEGVDLVVGHVETHGRPETEALVNGLEVLPRRRLEYRGVTLEEFDLDATLARNPAVVLVDELAHTNQPGSRHPKRYQDVQELLAAGIDVHTTLNVQHLESLRDVVEQITGVLVRETMPDSLLESADQIVLVDLPPEELLNRLAQGKVYVPEQASRAAGSFFRRGNLLALRELVLREAARRVDEDVRTYMRRRSISGPWPAGERLLVCVGPSPLSERLVRAARRLSEGLDASWVALHVATDKLSAAERERVARHLELAESLGAEVRTVTADSLVEAIVDFSARENVTKIVAGKPLASRWQDLVTGTLVDRVMKATSGIDIFVIGGGGQESPELPPRPSRPAPSLRPYLAAAALVALVTLLGQPLLPWLQPTNQVMLYLAAVAATASFLGRGPSLLAALLSVVSFNFFFVPPRFTFRVADTEYILTFLGLLLIGTLVSGLTARARERAEAAFEREEQALTLLSVSRDLSRALTGREVSQLAVQHLERLFGPVKLLLAYGGSQLQTDDGLEPQELATADWAFRHAQRAGRATQTLAGGRFQWHPLVSPGGCLGVVGLLSEVRPGEADRAQLLEAVLGQVAAALERLRLARSARDAELLKATEKLQSALLNSISHDLRIPLVSIKGALSSLLGQELILGEESRRQMLENALSETDRLNRLVANLLQMTRLDAGVLAVRTVPCDPWDLVSTTLDAVRDRLADRPIRLDLPEDLPLVPMDYVLIQQVLMNLLENAVRHGRGEIVVSARVTREGVEFGVHDEGPGVGDDLRDRVFDRFVRGAAPSEGSGLGLSICKGLVEAHGGRIWVEEGASFRFVLPLGTR